MNTPTTSVVSPTDPSFWVASFTVVAAVLLNVFHVDVAPYVPAAATLAAAIVVAVHVLGKHQVAAATVSAPTTVTTVSQEKVVDPAIALKVGELSRVVTEMAQAVTNQ